MEYLIHSNGGHPFKVVIDGECVKIYQRDEQEESHYTSTPLSVMPAKIFVGESPLTGMTEYSGGFGPAFDGNTILLQLGDNDYMFIGDSICTFTSAAEICSFMSPVGNNDVPYPYAIDTEGNCYLLAENAVVAGGATCDAEDPYEHYYAMCLITQDTGCSEPSQPEDTYKNIKAKYINGELYTMRLSFMPSIGGPDDEYEIEYFDGSVCSISYDELQALYQEFADAKGIRRLGMTEVNI